MERANLWPVPEGGMVRSSRGQPTTARATHAWLRRVRVAHVPGPGAPLADEAMRGLLQHFALLGHEVQPAPDGRTDAILTTARFGEPLPWREAVLFTARRRFDLNHTPAFYTVVAATPEQFHGTLDRFRALLDKEPPDPDDWALPGLAPQAHRILFEQGRRGGPILALERLVQAQAKSIRVLLVVGEDRPEEAYHFDLVGAHPRIVADEPEAFYEDIVLRAVTVLSTAEVTRHEVVGEPIPRTVWQDLATPWAMQAAARELGKRGFFADMVRIADLVTVPIVSDAVASQYSEGCFATWDPALGALIATTTGSARPVDKGNITDEDLAVIVGVRPDGMGALVRHVEGRRNDPPSSESVEMMDMDRLLPTVTLDSSWGSSVRVPVVRSKLHGHRGVAAYDPARVEYVPLDPPFYHYPVACATDGQARGVKAAFAGSRALQDPDDPRQVVFTVLPGHGVFAVEKWVPGAAPFEVLWGSMDAGHLQVEARVPQGPMTYVRGRAGRMVLEAP